MPTTFRIAKPNKDESPLSLYIIHDSSNTENLLLKCINSGLPIAPIQDGFKMSELIFVSNVDVESFPTNLLAFKGDLKMGQSL